MLQSVRRLAMKRKNRISVKTAAMVLSVIACISCTSGCGKKVASEPAATPKETVVQLKTDTTITVGSITCDALTQELTVINANYAELEELLPQLPELKKLTLEGILPDATALIKMQSMYPQIAFDFQLRIWGNTYSSDITVLDLAGTEATMEELSLVIPLLRNLEELSAIGSNLTDLQVKELASTYTDLLICFEFPLAGQLFATDCEEIDISGSTVTVEEVEASLPYFPRLKKLDMSFCGIPNEDMEALNQKYPDISIVWTLKIGEARTRTDAIYFYPAEVNYYPTSAEMEQLKYCHDMIAVDIGHTRATDCEFLWYMPNVKYLILADTGITDITPVGNLKELIYLELFNLKIDDYSPLLNCTKLQDLNIGTTYADPEPLTKMTWLHNLQWHRSDQNPETKEDVLKLPDQLPDTHVELFPRKKARNIGGPWRYIPNYYVFRDLIGATYFNQDQIADYWGEEDAARIMACDGDNGFSAPVLAQIVRERIDNGEPIIGIKDSSSEKAEILYETLMSLSP